VPYKNNETGFQFTEEVTEVINIEWIDIEEREGPNYMVYDTRNLKEDGSLATTEKVKEYRDAYRKFVHRKVEKPIYNVVLMISFIGEAPIYKEPVITKEIEAMWNAEIPVGPDGEWTE